MERMSTLDAGFFYVEHDNVPMHLGSLALFEGPAPTYEELTRLIAAKLPRVPRYRQVVRTMPLEVLRPMWVDDEHFEIGHHVRHAAVPAPGGKRQVRELAARIFATRLDRARPLWEAWLLEGLKGGRWAILSKVHHCVVDGIGGNDLMTAIFDITPDAECPAPAAWAPEPVPDMLDLMTAGLREATIASARQLSGLTGLVRMPLVPTGEILGYGRGLAASARRLAVPSATSLNGPIGPNRRWAWGTAPLAEIKEIRSAHGGTVNDVLLAAITRGFRDLLDERGELADGLVVRSLVPVSVRAEDEQGMITNRVSAVLANLPAGEPDPLRRLEMIREQMDELKRTSQAVGAEVLTGMLGLAPSMLLALGSRTAFQLPQPLVQTVTTNVPGPRLPLYLLGRRLDRIYPYVPIGDNVRISIAIFSYLERFTFGITADHDAVPDLKVLAKGIRRGLAELG
ncbi:MAG TPA: wax ester/triacylglycerol synthase family O-acyltransferase [Streptosporangiaceae bacterium]